ncbi:hypothetical protein BN8_02822 [Fibrisoma limi BUZ 3]|uniref:YD repeat-containing protein n=1 Tax=Fibrisoma limi BUZ 3 TaxID=1185876 RepID=I2GII2_9BACT|nr:hypothetical protein [Fibrisoma limi]CCH53707.1 hypothetical protein BN8_02822 [Fibrisoma limi BUZ 3]
MAAPRLIQHLIVFVLFGGLMFACSDHLNPSITPGSRDVRLRVKTITEELPNNKTWVSQFSYDAQGRLAFILAFQTPDSSVARVERTTYQYNAQNQLTQAQRRIVTRQPAFPLDEETLIYTYTATGQVATLNSTSTALLSFNYGVDNKPTGFTRSYIGTGGLRVSGGGGFSYTENNVTAASDRHSIIRLGGPPNTPDFGYSLQKTFTYDDKVNPFFGVFFIPAPGVEPSFYTIPSGNYVAKYTYFGGISNVLTLSKNNVLTEITNGLGSNSTSSVYQYQYNAANLPTLRTTLTNGSPTETLRFEYETY